MKENVNASIGGSTVSRRDFIAGAAGAAALVAIPGKRLYAGTDATTIPTPPSFPTGIPLYQQTYTNWAREISVADVWTCSPTTANDVVTLANWARTNGFRLRALGSAHGFAPTILSRGSSGAKYLLVNTMDSLNRVTVNWLSRPKSVTAQAGATLDQITVACEARGLGLRHTPAPGGITIAGGLAMNVHGTALLARGESLSAGHSLGTFSNLVLSLTAVVWDRLRNKYVLKTYRRDNPAIGPLLTHVGRAFVTEVTLQVGPSLKMRCWSRVDIDMPTLFAAPSAAGANSFSALSDQYGSVEVIYYPFDLSTAWLKIWQVAPVKPATSRAVTTPYNYPGEMPVEQADQIALMLRSNPAMVPQFSMQSATSTKARFTPTPGDTATQLYDLWGPAYCTTLYAPPRTLRLTTAAWGVVMKRSNLQRAVKEFYDYLNRTLQEFAAQGQYPYVGPVDIRAHGLDRKSEVQISNAVEPYLSGARPVPNHPEYDVVLWFALNNNVDQNSAAFNTATERWFLSNYSSYGVVRPEWTKTYAFTADGAYGGGWTNNALLTQTFPDTWRDQGYPVYSDWDTSVALLNSYDPHRVFSNSFLDTLMS